MPSIHCSLKEAQAPQCCSLADSVSLLENLEKCCHSVEITLGLTLELYWHELVRTAHCSGNYLIYTKKNKNLFKQLIEFCEQCNFKQKHIQDLSFMSMKIKAITFFHKNRTTVIIFFMIALLILVDYCSY